MSAQANNNDTSNARAENAPEPDRIVRLLVSAGRFGRTVTRALQPTHASFVWRILGTLDADGAVRMTHLATNEGVTPGTMTTNMQRLEQLQFVTRKPDPADGRATLFEITARGRVELQDHRAKVGEALNQFVEALSPLEVAAVDRAIEIMDEMSAASSQRHS